MRWSPSSQPTPAGTPIPVRNRPGCWLVLPVDFPAYHEAFVDRAGQLWMQNAVGTQTLIRRPYRLLDALSLASAIAVRDASEQIVPLESKQ